MQDLYEVLKNFFKLVRTSFEGVTNGKESTINRALGGSTYPG
jgi:hypothetical protein